MQAPETNATPVALATPELPETPNLAPTWRDLDKRTVFILLSSLGCLVVLYYFGRLPFFFEHLAPLFGDDPDVGLYGHLYLAGASVLTRMVLPLFFIRVVLRERARDFGYRMRGTRKLAHVYLLLLGIMVPVLIWASSTEAFLARYPLYDGAGRDWFHLLTYEAGYFFVFLSGESFWRGYMVNGLGRTFGYYGIAIMAIPYVMIHWGKPVPETFGALLTGCILGYLALKHRSFWLGVALHFSIALTMDLLALWRKGDLARLLGL